MADQLSKGIDRKPATTLKDAWNAFDPRPVESGNPYFVELTAARGSHATQKLKDMIELCAEDRFASIVFTGHRGSGKSTELLHLQEQLKPSCFSIYLNVVDFLDAYDLEYTDLFLLVARRVIEELTSAHVQLNQNILKGVEDWFRSVTKESEDTLSLSAGVTTEAKAGIEFPWVARLLAKFTADFKAGSSTKVTTREVFDKYFSGLAANTNLLLTEAAKALNDAGRPSRILILVDNLDRVPLHKSEELFFTHGSQLQNFACHVVYTIAIDTYYSRRGIGTVFPQNVILPNVKLKQGKADPTPNTAGIDSLAEIVGKRIDIKTLLEDHAVLQRAIQQSGGSVSQLMRLMGQAVLSARARNIQKLDSLAIEAGALALQQGFQRFLAPKDYKLLAHTASTKTIDKTPEYMELLGNTSILEYNGNDIWHDVNPVIEPIDAFQAAKRPPRKSSHKGRKS